MSAAELDQVVRFGIRYTAGIIAQSSSRSLGREIFLAKAGLRVGAPKFVFRVQTVVFANYLRAVAVPSRLVETAS